MKFFSVDVDSAPDLSRELGIMAVPSLFIFKDGEQKSTASGFQPKEVLSKWISETL
ncbi:MAG: thioredoxin family protein [Treponema sp.]|nr:thioredoxin family protein [Treponema sp.]